MDGKDSGQGNDREEKIAELCDNGASYNHLIQKFLCCKVCHLKSIGDHR